MVEQYGCRTPPCSSPSLGKQLRLSQLEISLQLRLRLSCRRSSRRPILLESTCTANAHSCAGAKVTSVYRGTLSSDSSAERSRLPWPEVQRSRYKTCRCCSSARSWSTASRSRNGASPGLLPVSFGGYACRRHCRLLLNSGTTG